VTSAAEHERLRADLSNLRRRSGRFLTVMIVMYVVAFAIGLAILAINRNAGLWVGVALSQHCWHPQ
jgi:hypothetical protein